MKTFEKVTFFIFFSLRVGVQRDLSEKKSFTGFSLLLFKQNLQMVQLTSGAIRVLYDDDKSSPLYQDPLVQVINIKAVAVAGGTRYR